MDSELLLLELRRVVSALGAKDDEGTNADNVEAALSATHAVINLIFIHSTGV